MTNNDSNNDWSRNEVNIADIFSINCTSPKIDMTEITNKTRDIFQTCFSNIIQRFNIHF